MKVSFVSSVFSDLPSEYQGSHAAEEPLDLLYAIGDCRKRFECDLVDVHNPSTVGRLSEAGAIVISTTNSYLQWNNHPLGLSTFYGTYDLVRRAVGDSIPMLVIGPHVPAHFDELIGLGHVIPIAGEAELSLVDAISKTESASVSDTRVLAARTPAIVSQLESLPTPAYDFTGSGKFAAHNHPLQKSHGHLYETSRGCPFFCSFCNTVTHRRRYRTKPARQIERDLTFLREQTTDDYVYLIDESFGVSPSWRDEVLPVLGRMGFQYGCQGNLKFLTERALEAMAEAKFVSVEFGLETSDEGILRAIGKDNVLSEAADRVNFACTLGIWPLLFLLVCLPGETLATIETTLEFLRQLDPRTRVSVGMPTPYWGTRLYKTGVESGVIPRTVSPGELYAFTGRVGNALTFESDDAKKFLSKHGPNHFLTPEMIEELETDLTGLLRETPAG